MSLMGRAPGICNTMASLPRVDLGLLCVDEAQTMVDRAMRSFSAPRVEERP